MCKKLLMASLTLMLLSGTVYGQKARFIRRMDPNFIPYVDSPTPVQQQWMRDNFWKMIGYSPYFDSRLSWYPETWIYFDLYAIYVGSEQSREHPDWILKDASGNNMYIPWDCGSGRGQYAADPS